MIPLYEFNRLVVLVATLPLEKKKTISEITVSDAIDGLAIFANNINPKEIIQNSIDFGLISNGFGWISLNFYDFSEFQPISSNFDEFR